MPSVVRVTEMYYYPVKSLGGIAADRLRFDAAGPLDDRRWMLVDGDGRMVTQRALPALARFTLAPAADGAYRINDGDGASGLLPRQPEGRSAIPVTVWKDRLSGWEVSGELSAWFSERLGRAVRLVFLGEASERRIPDPAARDEERVGFADGYPLLLCSQASLDALRERSGRAFDVQRFRPNLVVEGLPVDRELELGRLTFADGHLELLKPCVRCNIPAIDPVRGVYDKAVARDLKTHSPFRGQTVFGVNAVARGLTQLRIGAEGRFEAD